MTTESSHRSIRREPAVSAPSAFERPSAVESQSAFERRRTSRLLLRRPRADDLDWMTALHSEPLNYTHAPDRAHSPAQARTLSQSLLDAWDSDGIGYWIAEPAGEDPDLPEGRVGMAGVRPSSLAGRPCLNLYFRFVVGVRGRGFAAEACRDALLAAAAFDSSCPVVVRTRAANVPARRLADALGLTRRADLDVSTSGYVVYVSAW